MPKNGREDEPGSQGLSALVNNKKALKFIEEGGGGHLRGRSLTRLRKIYPYCLTAYLASVYIGGELIYCCKGSFKYYIIKEVGGWGQKQTFFDDL